MPLTEKQYKNITYGFGYLDTGHDSRTPTFSDDKLYNWLLGCHKKAIPEAR